MPLYEYECPECGKKFELRRSMSDHELEIKCPECGKRTLKRALSIFCTSSSSSAGGSCAPTGST